MAHLETDAALPGRLDELLRAGQRIGERLFHERVQAPLEDRQPDLHVCRRRYDDGDGFDTVQQRLG